MSIEKHIFLTDQKAQKVPKHKNIKKAQKTFKSLKKYL